MAAKKSRKKDILDCVRNVRLAILARPKNLFYFPKGPYYQEIRTRPPKECLTYIATERIKYLAKPLASKYTPKYVKPRIPKHHVKLSSLYFIPTPRLITLAKPKDPKSSPKYQRMKLEAEKRAHAEKRKAAELAKFRANWLQLRAIPRGKPPHHKHPVQVVYRGRKIFVKEEELANYLPKPLWVQKHGEPNMDTLNKLAVPRQRTEKYRLIIPRDRYFQIRNRNLKAVLPKRIAEICHPKVLPEEALLDLQFQPFTVPKAALKYEITPRMEELAMPRERAEAAEDDVADDAFTVPKRALNAICTKRTAELAKPVIRE
ncbi:hypothetical protein O3M35_000051 [Rhynocoris fuscipes]|uniref:Testicular haploid expressed gene protein-like n=1 Tax=Rhynocoris fuscipes TaxID=488301 RepID=A0AAW1DK15_9HEMI